MEPQRKARGTEREPDGRWSDPKRHLARAVLQDSVQCRAEDDGSAPVHGVLSLLQLALQVEPTGLRAGVRESDVVPVVVGAVRTDIHVDVMELQVRNVWRTGSLQGRRVIGDNGLNGFRGGG